MCPKCEYVLHVHGICICVNMVLVCGLHICGACAWVCAEARGGQWVSCSLSLPSVKVGSLKKPGSRLPASHPQPCSRLFASDAGVMAAHVVMAGLYVGAGIGI